MTTRFHSYVFGAIVLGFAMVACSDSSSPRDASSTVVPSTIEQTDDLLLEPTGPHAVGVRELAWLGDDSRLTAWYPAERGTGDGPPPYIESDRLAAFQASDSDVARIHITAAAVDATPLQDLGALPTVVFVPVGDLGPLSTVLLQQLASHGYLVLLAEASANLPEASDDQVAGELVRMRRVIDLLISGTDSGAVGLVDPDRLAIGGHSAGGSFAFEMALVEPRVHAVFDLDGALFRGASSEPVKVPALVVMTSQGLGGHHEAFPETFSILASTRTLAVVGLNGADHFDVSDAPTVAPVLTSEAGHWPLGPIGAIATTSTAELVLRFLDAVFGENGSVPEGSALVDGVPGATATADFLRLG